MERGLESAGDYLKLCMHSTFLVKLLTVTGKEAAGEKHVYQAKSRAVCTLSGKTAGVATPGSEEQGSLASADGEIVAKCKKKL